VTNSFEENNCENTNTLAQGCVHLVLLAHLQRQWSLSGREGFGRSGEVTKVSGVFEELK
jgi:hypothetical protein